jgi:membrane protein DedA with SNARE-associated domain
MKVLIFLTFAIAVLSLVKPWLIKDFIEWIRGIILLLWNWNYFIVFISSLIESFPVLWVVVPGQNILLIVGWFFAEESTLKLIYVSIITILWAVAGNYIGYILGVYYGDEFFKKYWLWFSLGETEVKYMKKWIKKWGPLGVTLWKFHNLARAFIPFIAGSMGMKKTSFFIYNVIGSTIRAITIIILWVLFAKTYETIIDYIGYIFLGIMILTGIYIWRFKKKQFLKYIEEKNAELEKKL